MVTLSRRRFLHSAAIAATSGSAGALAGPAGANAAPGGPPQPERIPAPTPIAGGFELPDGPLLRVFAPGDPSVVLPFSGARLGGLDVEPSTFTDRKGFTAVAYHAGTATGRDGTRYDLETDVRAYRGPYVASDGTRRFGTFAFI